jgi:hypothetical protein
VKRQPTNHISQPNNLLASAAHETNEYLPIAKLNVKTLNDK